MKTAVVVLKRSIRTVLFSVFVRSVIYAVLLAGIAYGMLWGAVVYDEAFYNEIGPVETLETVFALSAALIFLLAGRMDASKQPASIVIAGFLFCLFIRESDFVMDTYVAEDSWKICVATVFLLIAVYSLKNMRSLYRSILRFIHLPSFGIFLSGLLVLMAFSRLFGYGPFWKAIMDNPSYRTVKTIVEEGVEQMGYFLVLIAAFEYLHDARMRTRLSRKGA